MSESPKVYEGAAVNRGAALAQYREAVAAGLVDAPERGERSTPWEKLREKPASRTLAINAHCAGCMGWGEGQERPPGVVRDIRECSSSRCALFAFRPYRQEGAA